MLSKHMPECRFAYLSAVRVMGQNNVRILTIITTEKELRSKVLPESRMLLGTTTSVHLCFWRNVDKFGAWDWKSNGA